MSKAKMKDFWLDYRIEMERAFNSMLSVNLKKAAKAIAKAQNVIVAGNGGSAAIANHLACDVGKGCYPQMQNRVISLSCNTPLITAIGNDVGFEFIFSRQLDLFAPEQLNDVVILISSSGKSHNIIKAAEWVRDSDLTLIGFTGFDGGALKELADISIHVDSDNYGIIEDCHQAAMHAISQYMARHMFKPSPKSGYQDE